MFVESVGDVVSMSEWFYGKGLILGWRVICCVYIFLLLGNKIWEIDLLEFCYCVEFLFYVFFVWVWYCCFGGFVDCGLGKIVCVWGWLEMVLILVWLVGWVFFIVWVYWLVWLFSGMICVSFGVDRDVYDGCCVEGIVEWEWYCVFWS